MPLLTSNPVRQGRPAPSSLSTIRVVVVAEERVHAIQFNRGSDEQADYVHFNFWTASTRLRKTLPRIPGTPE
ncbi:hypothetical protein HYQ46_008488 [Verticillium longisporum]|nr:hypothetical protein HYQ46_008488 [Verticillium longisporum]